MTRSPSGGGATEAPSASRLRFAFPVWHPSQVRQGALLAESLSRFGGRLSRSRVTAFVDASLDADIAPLEDAGCEVSRFSIPAGLASLPFAAKCAGAAAAEEGADARGGALVWMDPDSLVLDEPSELALAPGVDIALRPVDHANVGSPADAPPDAFWGALYSMRGLSRGRIWHVRGTVDHSEVRGYYNAGLLAARPGAGILRGWLATLRSAVAIEGMDALLWEDGRRSVFLHQAALACEVMARAPRERVRVLPETYNFPAHMADAHPLTRPGPPRIVTCRYGDADDVGWMGKIHLSDEARRWLSGRQTAPSGLYGPS